MRINSRPHTAAWICLLFCASGCGEGTPSVPSRPPDAGKSRSLLESVLQAWKAGDSSLRAGAFPEARFVDEDHAAGYELVDFALQSGGDAVGNTLNVPVDLTLRRPHRRGKQLARKSVTYQVVFEPAPAVFRNDP